MNTKFTNRLQALINGAANTLRDLNHTKYETASRGHYAGTYVGSPYAERYALFEEILSNYPEEIKLKIKNQIYTLHRAAGKAHLYECEMDCQQQSIYPFDVKPGKQGKVYIMFDCCCMLRLVIARRGNDRQRWKFGEFINVGEELITII